MGGATVAGRVIIGKYSSIGTNATILPDVKIGENVYIGAGSVVIKDIKDNSVIVGVPGKFLREFKPQLNLSIFD
jgi:acetyltransferase-like isoleucine patch superfamily enzyme